MDAYVSGVINEQLDDIIKSANDTFENFSKKYIVVLDHRIMEVRRFFYKRLVFSDNRCSNRFFLVSAGIFVG